MLYIRSFPFHLTFFLSAISLSLSHSPTHPLLSTKYTEFYLMRLLWCFHFIFIPNVFGWSKNVYVKKMMNYSYLLGIIFSSLIRIQLHFRPVLHLVKYNWISRLLLFCWCRCCCCCCCWKVCLSDRNGFKGDNRIKLNIGNGNQLIWLFTLFVLHDNLYIE